MNAYLQYIENITCNRHEFDWCWTEHGKLLRVQGRGRKMGEDATHKVHYGMPAHPKRDRHSRQP